MDFRSLQVHEAVHGGLRGVTGVFGKGWRTTAKDETEILVEMDKESSGDMLEMEILNRVALPVLVGRFVPSWYSSFERGHSAAVQEVD